MSLVVAPNLDDTDGAYADLIAAHKGRSPVESAALNARLILVLVNHIGSRAILAEALGIAVSSAKTEA